MVTEIRNDVTRVIILDISGIYAQIHNQGYFDKETLKDLLKQYSNTEHWCVIVI